MTDNDSFLYALRQAPRPAFAHDLKARLDAQPKPASGHHSLARAARLLVAACIVFALLMIISPQARAQVADFVADVIVTTFGDIQIRAVNHAIEGENQPAASVVEMSVAEAQTVLPFKLPIWIPDGYVRQDRVTVIHYDSQGHDIAIGQTWTRPGSADLVLSVMNNAHPQMVTGSNSNAREVQIGPTKGVIFEGTWNPDTGHYGGTILNLVWTDSGLSYTLTGDGIPESDLIHVADSLP